MYMQSMKFQITGMYAKRLQLEQVISLNCLPGVPAQKMYLFRFYGHYNAKYMKYYLQPPFSDTVWLHFELSLLYIGIEGCKTWLPVGQTNGEIYLPHRKIACHGQEGRQ